MKYTKTSAGQSALTDRAVALSQQQRAALIMFDGKRLSSEVLAAMAGVGVAQADIDHLVNTGLLVALEPGVPPLAAPSNAPSNAPGATPSSQTDADRYALAYPLAGRLSSSLGLRGFRLNLAVEGAANHQELLALLPKIQDAVGKDKCRELENALKG
jgi:hypothetical protein